MKRKSTDEKKVFSYDVSESDTKEALKALPEQWQGHIGKILYPTDKIIQRVAELAKEISEDYKDKGTVLCVGLLNGAFIFVADIMRQLKMPYNIDFMTLSSYGSGMKSSGSIRCKKDVSMDPAGRHVLILEDLIDSGNTLAWLQKHLESKKCASVKICCLLDKIEKRTVDVKIDYVGWNCPDEFVVGYGMDYDETYRCLPFVGVLKPEVYQ